MKTFTRAGDGELFTFQVCWFIAKLNANCLLIVFNLCFKNKLKRKRQLSDVNLVANIKYCFRFIKIPTSKYMPT